ncbi:hypothetical protein F66182_9115 [Fusarium sp. NRRL 66182]|nr:hypothetical protein F66182_9115 [Fusarium sp. NRRL 66182]
MRDLLNKVLYGSSGPQGAPNDGSTVFSIRPNSSDDLLFITPAGAPKEAPPLYTVSKRLTKPSFVVFRGHPSPENTIATATMHLTSSTVDLSVYNQHMVIKNSSLSGSWSFDTPNMGKFKWRVNPLTGTGFELSDQAGQKLAKYGNAGLARLGEKQLAVYVPGDEFFMVTVLLSAVASKELAKVIDKVVGEVAGAVGGI